MNKAVCLFVLVIGLALSSYAQSAADLKARYPVVTSYEVRPGILATPRYTVDGQVCEMSIQREHFVRGGVYLISYMSDKLIREIVDELVPVSERGEPFDGHDWDGPVIGTGQAEDVIHDYRNVNITVHQSAFDPRLKPLVVVVSWKNRKCEKQESPLPPGEYPQ